MKLGGFGRIADYDAIRAAGFDYAELDLPELEELSDDPAVSPPTADAYIAPCVIIMTLALALSLILIKKKAKA